MATIQIYSVGSIAVSRANTGESLSNDNPITEAVNGNAFSWKNPSDVAMTFGTTNASVTFADSNDMLDSNPVDGATITDQKLEGSTTIDGTTYNESPNDLLWQSPAGVYVRAEYSVTLYDAAGKAYNMVGVTIASGYNPVVAGVTFADGAPPAGTTLYYHQNGSTFDADPDVPLSAICFAADTLIQTAQGPVAVADLRPGMLVQTRDAGLQPVLWIGSRHLDAATLSAAPHLHPIRIRQGALGAGLPARDLVVSPQHRVLVRSGIALKMFGATEVLVAAKSLLGLDGVEIAQDLTQITYVHFMLPEHQVVFAEGAESESLYTGKQALKALGKAARHELAQIFPEILDSNRPLPAPARTLAPVAKARQLALRHARNHKPLVG